MSWQCPTCETVNQDVTPVCTVCDTLAPVIESFLSLESIEDLREYNSKLDEVHRLEISGDYDRMLDVALEAISIYKENGIAVDKAKQALKKSSEVKLTNQLSILLNSTIEKKNYLAATAVIRLIENFHLDVPELASIKSEVKEQLAKEKAQTSKEKEIDEILKSSYKEIVDLHLDEALNIIVEGLEKYPSSKLLQYRRDDIKKLAETVGELKKKTESRKKPIHKPIHRTVTPASPTPQQPPDVITLDKKRKFPKPKRK